MSDAAIPARTLPARSVQRYKRDPDWLRNQLPMGMLEDEFLHRFLGIFQEVADTFMHQIDNLEHVFDPAVAPDNLVRLMGWWIGLEQIDDTLPHVRQRVLVRYTAQLLRWRGTSQGLLRGLLELVTGETATIEDSGGVYLEGEAPGAPPHVVVRISALGLAEKDDLVEILGNELPAPVTFELFIGDERVWPMAAPVVSPSAVGAGIREEAS